MAAAACALPTWTVYFGRFLAFLILEIGAAGLKTWGRFIARYFMNFPRFVF